MDPLTWLSLGLQLCALCSIVGALLLYLLKKVRGAELAPPPTSKTVLITSVDTSLGLQIATYLSERGWRVLAGCRARGLGARLASSWAAQGPHAGAVPPIATVELDVAREDSLEEAARATAQHLPAGEPGVWAVIHTAGASGKGGAACWESLLRANVLGSLRLARAFTPLLSAAAHANPNAGRLFMFGLTSDSECEAGAPTRPQSCEGGEALAGVCASRWAVCGASAALRGTLRARGVRVSLLHAPHTTAAQLYAPPQLLPSTGNSRPETPASETSGSSCSVTMPGEAAEYCAKVLSPCALKTLEEALTAPNPKNTYYLKQKPDPWFTRVPSIKKTLYAH